MRIGISEGTDALGARLRERLRAEDAQVVTLGPAEPADGKAWLRFELETGVDGAPPPLDRVAHLAAFTRDGAPSSDCLACESRNGGGTLRLLEALDRAALRVFVNLSTWPIWDPAEAGLIESPRAGSLRSAEMLVDAYAHRYGFRALHLRLPQVYGPKPSDGGAVGALVRKALDGAPLEIAHEGRVHLVHCDDAAAAVAAALGSDAAGVCEVVPPEPATWPEVAEAILDLTGSRSEIVLAKQGAGSAAGSPEHEPARRALRLGPFVPLRDGIAAMLERAGGAPA